MPEKMDYERRLKAQIDQYRSVANIHDLPGIFHYWSNKHLRPKINSVIGVDSIPDFYANAFAAVRPAGPGKAEFLSLGSGDCTVEIQVAKALVARGLGRFSLTCLEVSPVLADRARTAIEASGLTECLRVEVADLNSWQPTPSRYDGMMAHHSLHHIVNLEGLFDGVASGLRPTGTFVTNDIIGRNGHLRWPEVKELIDGIWAFLDDSKKFNHQLQRLDREFIDWDCSTEGFEGIRAQDILPLMVSRFRFDAFLACGGVVDIFVDRAFGHNFDADNPKDAAFIDFLELLNEKLIDAGLIKPTMMYAVTGSGQEARTYRHWTPEFCVRPAGSESMKS